MNDPNEAIDLLDLQLQSLGLQVEQTPKQISSDAASPRNTTLLDLEDAAIELTNTINTVRHLPETPAWLYSTRYRDFMTYSTSPLATGSRFHVCSLRNAGNKVCAKYPVYTTTNGLGSPTISKRSLEDIQQEIFVFCHKPIQTHDNIVKLLGISWMSIGPIGSLALPVLLMEQSPYGSLEEFFQFHSIAPTARLGLVRDIGQGLLAINRAGIFHGDIKPENILIFEDRNQRPVAKIADFGSCVLLSKLVGGSTDDWEESTNFRPRGTSAIWNAPEWMESLTPIGLAYLDCYAFGLLTWYICLHGDIPFASMSLENVELLKSQDSMVNYATRTVQKAFTSESALQCPHHSDTCRFEQYFASVVIPRQVFALTLPLEPTDRSLSEAVEILVSAEQLHSLNSERSRPKLDADCMEQVLVPHKASNSYNLLSDAPKPIKNLVLKNLRRRAAENTLSQQERGYACLQLAFALLDGFSGVYDTKSALHWLLKSAHLGCIAAYAVVHNVFAAYEESAGRASPEQVYDWLIHAASLSSPTALRTLELFDEASFRSAQAKAMSRNLPVPSSECLLGALELLNFVFSEAGWAEMQHFAVGAILDNKGNQILHYGAAYGVDIQRFHAFIVRFKPDLDAQNSDENTALLLAMRSGHPNHANLLLQYGCSASLTNKLGQSPCHWMIHVHDRALVGPLLDLMLQRGADASKLADRDFHDEANHYNLMRQRGTALHWAVFARRLDIVRALLERGMSRLTHEDATQPDKSVLHMAVELHEPEILRCILENWKGSEPIPATPAAGGASEQRACRDIYYADWGCWTMRLRHHWHALSHGSRHVAAFKNTLLTLLDAKIAGNDVKSILIVAMTSQPLHLLLTVFEVFEASVKCASLLAEALSGAITQMPPTMVEFVVEKIMEHADIADPILKKLYFEMANSTMPVPRALESLLQVVGDVDIRNSNGNTAFVEAVYAGNFDTASEYIRLGANVNVLLPARNTTSSQPMVNILHYLILLNNDSVVSAIDYLLEPRHGYQTKPDLLVHRGYGKTALHFACMWENMSVFNLIYAHCEHSGIINAANIIGETALHLAARTGVCGMVKKLCEGGAEINARTSYGKTARDICHSRSNWARDEDRNSRPTWFWESLLISRLHIDAYLAQRGGAKSRKFSPLSTAFRFIIHAAKSDQANLFEESYQLLPVPLKSIEYLDALLFLAASCGSRKTVKKLVAKGANVNARSKLGRTPLHAAAAKGDVRTVMALVKAGASLCPKNNHGKTPIAISHERDDRSMVRYLLFECSQLEAGPEKDGADFEFEKFLESKEETTACVRLKHETHETE